MSQAFKAVPVTDRVHWVGAVDWDMRNFHGYLTGRGTTYNAYLVLGEKVALIDTVKAAFKEEMLSRIASVVDPGSIDYVVSNHSEMDHSGCLPEAVAAIDPEAVFASKNGCKALGGHFRLDRDITAVADGEELGLGGLKLSFFETPMCHWPDSMVTYLHEDELLFSQDAFGMHLAGYERFADQVEAPILDYEAAKYYANILFHLSPMVQRTLKKVASLGVSFRIVAPDHGPIWRTPEGIEHILGCYERWAAQAPTRKAVVVFDTMWQSTARMARAIADGLVESGASVKLMSMGASHRSDVITELLDAGALVVGSPTMNNNIFPSIADVMVYIKGLKPKNLIGAAFGSYGWSGEAPKDLHAMLREMGVETVADPLRVCYVPDSEALAGAHELGLAVGNRLTEKLAAGG